MGLTGHKVAQSKKNGGWPVDSVTLRLRDFATLGAQLPRPAASTLIGRALRLCCPRCGEAKMFTGLFRMHETCTVCHLRFEREPGYFLGSIYINYGITAMLMLVGWMTFRFGFGFEPRPVAFGLTLLCVAFGVFFFRYARALWLAMDCRFESDAFFDRESPG
jgi:hypothetical protein